MAVVKNTFEADINSYERALRKLEEAERKLVNTVETGTKSIDAAHKKTATSATQAATKTKTAFKEAKKGAGTLTTAIDKIGVRLLAAFAIERVLTFFATTTREMVSLALKAQPVRRAFERIADPTILDGLRKAVKGTVSDLELMAQAVKAENLEIPIKNLATLFEFAQRRARDTGEEVDFLVESIVSGIGRRSPLVLDNLGISAVRLRSKLKGVGIETASIATVTEAVSEIVQEEMDEMGGAVESSADKVDKAAASYENLLTVMGEKLTPTVGKTADGFSALTNLLLSDSIPTINKLAAVLLGISGTAALITGNVDVLAVATKGWTDQLKEIEDANKPIEDAQKRWEEFARIMQDILNEKNFGDPNIIDPLFDTASLQTVKDYKDRITEVEAALVKLRVSTRDLDFDTGELAIAEAFLSGIQAELAFRQGKLTEAQKDAIKAAAKLKEEQEELEKQFKATAKALDDEFAAALKSTAKDIDDFIKATQKLNDEANKITERRLSLARGNIELEAKISGDLIALENAQFENKIEILERRKITEPELTKELQKRIELVTQQHEQNLTDITDKGIDEREKSRADELQLILNTTSQVFGAIAQFRTLQHNAELAQISERMNAEMDSFDMREGRLERELELDLARLDRADISEKKRSEAENQLLSQFDTRVEAEKQGLKDLEDERKAVQIRAAQDAKALAIFEAIINVAKAITAHGVTTPTAIAAGILGAVQIALIQAQPIPGFFKGKVDILGPGTTTSDSILARLSVHESVINSAGTHAYPDELLAANNLTLPALIDKKYVQPAVKQAVTDIWPMVAAISKDKKHTVNIGNVKEIARATADQQFVTSYLDKS